MHRRIAALSLAALVAFGACGADDPAVEPVASTTTTADARVVFPVTVTAANGQVTIGQQPTNIVSLSPTATEMLFVIEAGSQVGAVDDQSSYPKEAPRTKLSGYQPNLEAILGENPDLVVLANDPGSIVKGLEAAKVPALLLPAAATLDDAYGQIVQLGQATGHIAAADAVVKEMRSGIDKVVTDVAGKGKGLTYYHELDDTLYSVTSRTFIGALYGQLGLTNIADGAKSGGDYPQLSAEVIVQKNPDLIFLADTKCCKQSLETVAARPGFDKVKAVKNGNVVELDDDVASRWGPRVVDLLQQAATAVEKAGAAKAAA
jgi:iron complex transport system substrate-binding protein